jgi:hypothetical protein
MIDTLGTPENSKLTVPKYLAMMAAGVELLNFTWFLC